MEKIAYFSFTHWEQNLVIYFWQFYIFFNLVSMF